MPYGIVSAKPEELETWQNHLNFRFLIRGKSSSYSPMAAWVLLIDALQHGVSRADFSLTEPISSQAVYVDHSRNQDYCMACIGHEYMAVNSKSSSALDLTSSRKTSVQWCCVSTTPY